MKYLALLLLPLLGVLTSCSTTTEAGGGVSEKAISINWPKPSGKVIKISNTQAIRSSKDYKMATVDGTGLRGNGNQSEGQEAPFYLYRGGKLKNVTAKNWPESASSREPNTLYENINIPDVGEDAISTYKGHNTKGLTIRNSRFAKATDKCLQLNEGTGDVLIEGCIFDGFKSAIRIKEGVRNVTIRDCAFIKGKRAIVLDKGVQKPKIINCRTYNGVVLLYQG